MSERQLDYAKRNLVPANLIASRNSRPRSRTAVKKCREALGERAAGLTDGEIEQMREFLYQLLDIAAEELEQDLRKSRTNAEVGRVGKH